MKIAFFGTPQLSVATLEALCDAGHDVVLVVSRADQRRGRGGELSPSPVKAVALARGLQVTANPSDAIGSGAEIGVLVAYGRLIKADVLAQFPIVNLHPSLLPRWRGATPVEAAILAGDERTGICLMRLVEEMDAGPIYERVQTLINDGESSADLYARLFAEGNQLLLAMLDAGLPIPEPQEGDATYCGRTTPEDFHVDWTTSADRIVRLSRVGRPWSVFRGRRVGIAHARVINEHAVDRSAEPGSLHSTLVQTNDGVLELVRVKPEGKGEMDATAWVNGLRLQPGERFEAKDLS